MEFLDYLKILTEKDGSDLYLTTGAYPSIRVHGRLETLEEVKLAKGLVDKIAHGVMSEKQQCTFDEESELNLAISESGLGRFRVNVFKQRGETAMVIRRIPIEIPLPEALGLPEVLKEVTMEKRGLILFVGATGSGKSTSLASLINYRNMRLSGHIITIEDPVEFTHCHKKSLVNQREVGIDTLSYQNALKNTLRQAPDVILIGEIRDRDTMQHAITFAETGHLCLSTLHSNNANQAISRIINFFPQEHHQQLLLDLSLNLRAVISQRLIPTVDHKRVAAIEVLIGSPLVKELIQQGKIHNLKEVMEKSENIGMQTFDTALFKLYKAGKISEEEALNNADSRNNLRLRISLSQGVKPDDHLDDLSLNDEVRKIAGDKFELPRPGHDDKPDGFSLD